MGDKQFPIVSFKLGRRPSIAVDGRVVKVRLPTWFGGEAWQIPIDQVGVWPAPESGYSQALNDKNVFFRGGLRVPLAKTRSNYMKPNLALLCKTPQRVPPIRRFVGTTSGLSRSASRSARGDDLDGVLVRVGDRDATLAELVALGAERVDSPIEWLKPTRITLPASAEEARQAARRAKLMARSAWVLMAAVLLYQLGARLLSGSVGFWVVTALMAAAAPAWGVPLMVMVRSKRKREAKWRRRT